MPMALANAVRPSESARCSSRSSDRIALIRATVGGGAFQIKGAVTGSGGASISGGVLDLGSSFGENVVFSGTTGKLKLAKSISYAGAISGFGVGGTATNGTDYGTLAGPVTIPAGAASVTLTLRPIDDTP